MIKIWIWSFEDIICIIYVKEYIVSCLFIFLFFQVSCWDGLHISYCFSKFYGKVGNLTCLVLKNMLKSGWCSNFSKIYSFLLRLCLDKIYMYLNRLNEIKTTASNVTFVALSPPSLPIMINYNKNSLEFLVIKCP